MTVLIDDSMVMYNVPDLHKIIEERVFMLQKDIDQIHQQYLDSIKELEKQKRLKEEEFYRRREELMNSFVRDLQNYVKESGS